MITYLSFVIALFGLILYLACSTAKPAEVGRLMFSCGLLVFLFQVCGTHVISIFK